MKILNWINFKKTRYGQFDKQHIYDAIPQLVHQMAQLLPLSEEEEEE